MVSRSLPARLPCKRVFRALAPEHPRRGLPDLDSAVVQARDERRALNEAYFRDVNERVVEDVKDLAGEQAAFNILCECSSLRCAQRIVVTPAEYELLHEDPKQFIVALGHVEYEIEDSVTRTDRYEVVLKRGHAGVVAEEAAADS